MRQEKKERIFDTKTEIVRYKIKRNLNCEHFRSLCHGGVQISIFRSTYKSIMKLLVFVV